MWTADGADRATTKESACRATQATARCLRIATVPGTQASGGRAIHSWRGFTILDLRRSGAICPDEVHTLALGLTVIILIVVLGSLSVICCMIFGGLVVVYCCCAGAVLAARRSGSQGYVLHEDVPYSLHQQHHAYSHVLCQTDSKPINYTPADYA